MPRNTSVTDTRLVRRSQQGDRRAFRALLTRHDWRLRGLAHALLLDPALVDAVLRVAYMRAWREVVRIDPRDDAAAWLYRVVYNACIDGLRRESTRIGAAPPTAAAVPAADAPDVPDVADAADVQDVPDVPDAADVPDDADAPENPRAEPMPVGGNGATPAPTGGRQARIVEALAALAPADRVAVVLIDREGFAPEAAARILGLTPDVVVARLVGARARLTHQLADVLAAAPAPAEEAESPPAATEIQADEAEAQAEEPRAESDEAEAQAEEPRAGSDEAEAPAEEPEAASEEPKIELDDSTSADPADTKVASRSAAGGSPNGSSGTASTNGSDDSGGGAS